MDSRGQAFEGFNLLIGAIVAFAILTIIIGAIYAFDSIKANISARRIADGLNNSIQNPTGDVIVVKEVRIDKTKTFSASEFSRKTGLPKECFSFMASQGIESIAAFSPNSSDAESITFNSGILTDVYFQCYPSANQTGPCPRIACVVSFGKNPSNP